MNKLAVLITFLVSFLIISWIYQGMTFRYGMSMSFVIVPDTRNNVELANHALSVSEPLIESLAFSQSVAERYAERVGREYFPQEEDAHGLREWQRIVDAYIEGKILIVETSLDDSYATEQLLRAVANTYLQEIEEYYPSRRGMSFQILELPYQEKHSAIPGLILALLGASATATLLTVIVRIFQRSESIDWKSTATINRSGEELRHRLGDIDSSLVSKEKKNKPQRRNSQMVYPEEVEGPDYQARKIEPPAQTQTYKKKQKEGVSGGRDEKSEDITSHTSGTKSQNAKLLDASLLAASPKAGGAPANLPVVMDDENAGDGRVDDAPVPEKESDPRFEGEPTTEEYKRRLNELLRGKMI